MSYDNRYAHNNTAPMPGGANYPQYTAEDRSASMLAHLSAPAAFLLSAGWLSFLGPLIVWFIYKDRSVWTRRAAAGAFNFNVSFWIINLIAWVCIFTVIGAIVGLPLLVISFVVAAWCHIKGAIRSSKGEPYDYPFQIPILH